MLGVAAVQVETALRDHGKAILGRNHCGVCSLDQLANLISLNHWHLRECACTYIFIFTVGEATYNDRAAKGNIQCMKVYTKCIACMYMCGESRLTITKIFTHHPSSQGWASRCPSHLCLCVCTVRVWCIRSGFPFFSSSATNLASVLYTCMSHTTIHV